VGTEQWYSVSEGEAAKQNNIFERLLTQLRTTYCGETHGVELECLAQQQDGKLHVDAFVDWYIRWFYEKEIFSSDD
jgi:hypothetical protein